MPKYKILPLFIPFYGCKSRCIYCNQHAVTGIGHDDMLHSVKKQMGRWLKISNRWDEIAFYGGTFSNLPTELRRALYSLAEGPPLRVSTCPDSISDDFIHEIQAYNIRTVELGVQSLSDKVLTANKRRYTARNVSETFARLNPLTKTSLQLMTGMHTETQEDISLTARLAPALKAPYARIYPTLVFKDTELEALYRQGLYTPPSSEETLMRATWLYISLEAAGTKVIRVGLPPEAEEAVAGFRHPAMGELVKTLAVYAFTALYDRVPGFNYTGYRGLLKEKYGLPQMAGLDTILTLAEKIKEKIDEGGGWFSQEQIASFACRLTSEAHL